MIDWPARGLHAAQRLVGRDAEEVDAVAARRTLAGDGEAAVVDGHVTDGAPILYDAWCRRLPALQRGHAAVRPATPQLERDDLTRAPALVGALAAHDHPHEEDSAVASGEVLDALAGLRRVVEGRQR